MVCPVFALASSSDTSADASVEIEAVALIELELCLADALLLLRTTDGIILPPFKLFFASSVVLIAATDGLADEEHERGRDSGSGAAGIEPKISVGREADSGLVGSSTAEDKFFLNFGAGRLLDLKLSFPPLISRPT